MNRMIFLIALCIAGAFAASSDISSKIGKNDVPCDRSLLKGLEKCCNVPKLLPIDTAFECQKSNEEADKKRSEKQVASCLLDCIMKNRTHVSSSGEFNWRLITREFTENQNGTWLKLVNEKITVCKARLEKWGKKPENGKCDSRPSKFMSCLGRELSRDCPVESQLDTDNKLGCKQKFAHLHECSAFAKDGDKKEKDNKKENKKQKAKEQKGKNEKKEYKGKNPGK